MKIYLATYRMGPDSAGKIQGLQPYYENYRFEAKNNEDARFQAYKYIDELRKKEFIGSVLLEELLHGKVIIKTNKSNRQVTKP